MAVTQAADPVEMVDEFDCTEEVVDTRDQECMQVGPQVDLQQSGQRNTIRRRNDIRNNNNNTFYDAHTQLLQNNLRPHNYFSMIYKPLTSHPLK